MDNKKNIIANTQKLMQEVKDYIVNTEHFIFYWIHNSEVMDFIEANPEDYEDMIHLNVESINGASVTVRICLGEPVEGGENVIRRYCTLENFREITNAKWLEYNGKIREKRINEAEQNLKYYKTKVEEYEQILKELKEGK